MGLFGGSESESKKVTYGKAETDALQPWLFDFYRRMMQGGGTPTTWAFRVPLENKLNEAYGRAQSELAAAGTSGGDALGRLLAGLTENRGAAETGLYGSIGQSAQAAKMGTAGGMANYLARLTAARPQYSLYQGASPWDAFWSGIETLNRGFKPIMGMAGAGQAAMGSLAPMGTSLQATAGKIGIGPYAPLWDMQPGLQEFYGY